MMILKCQPKCIIQIPRLHNLDCLLPRVCRERSKYPVNLPYHSFVPGNKQYSSRVAQQNLDNYEPKTGTKTPVPETSRRLSPRTTHYFEAGYALFAKRPSRPFPPPFSSPPSGSFSDPLSTHNRSWDRRPKVNGEMIRGVTNGDDAVLVSENFICANDGVGAWATREKGHAALWSRLILHFWAVIAEEDGYGHSPNPSSTSKPNPKQYLDTAYTNTNEATSASSSQGKGGPWLGTTTASSALISTDVESDSPIIYVTQLGDSQVLIFRPGDNGGRKGNVLFKTKEQWHWFDCPRQLGTNSPDTPLENAVMDQVKVQEGDVVLAMTDGVVDNLWEHEIVENVIASLDTWARSERTKAQERGDDVDEASMMKFVAGRLVKAARKIAEDAFAESPFMERAVEEGLSIEGGKLDDISVVAAICKRRKTDKSKI